MILFLSFFSPLRVLKKKLRAFFFCYMSVHIAFSFFFYFSSTLLLLPSLLPTRLSFFFFSIEIRSPFLFLRRRLSRSFLFFLSFVPPPPPFYPQLPPLELLLLRQPRITYTFLFFFFYPAILSSFPFRFFFSVAPLFLVGFFLKVTPLQRTQDLKKGENRNTNSLFSFWDKAPGSLIQVLAVLPLLILKPRFRKPI